jgi:hypothetical protein
MYLSPVGVLREALNYKFDFDETVSSEGFWFGCSKRERLLVLKSACSRTIQNAAA